MGINIAEVKQFRTLDEGKLENFVKRFELLKELKNFPLGAFIPHHSKFPVHQVNDIRKKEIRSHQVFTLYRMVGDEYSGKGSGFIRLQIQIYHTKKVYLECYFLGENEQIEEISTEDLLNTIYGDYTIETLDLKLN